MWCSMNRTGFSVVCLGFYFWLPLVLSYITLGKNTCPLSFLGRIKTMTPTQGPRGLHVIARIGFLPRDLVSADVDYL